MSTAPGERDALRDLLARLEDEEDVWAIVDMWHETKAAQALLSSPEGNTGEREKALEIARFWMNQKRREDSDIHILARALLHREEDSLAARNAAPVDQDIQGAPAMRFRKKPVVIEACRFDGTWQSVRGLKPGPNEIYFVDRSAAKRPNQLDIRTLEGSVTANVGDWIIKGIAGEFYPCRSDIFAATYEAAVASDDGCSAPAEIVPLPASSRGIEMTSMVENVARAMADCEMEHRRNFSGATTDDIICWQSYLPFARAALQALREPSEEMINAVEVDHDDRWNLIGPDEAKAVWQAMLDAALSETE